MLKVHVILIPVIIIHEVITEEIIEEIEDAEEVIIKTEVIIIVKIDQIIITIIIIPHIEEVTDTIITVSNQDKMGIMDQIKTEITEIIIVVIIIRDLKIIITDSSLGKPTWLIQISQKLKCFRRIQLQDSCRYEV
jgi:hypothetical protein